ncbi:MAG: nitrogen fixation protein NifH [Theionarchaea archaeon]|nr:nitrogen fixation protein NifH [Theionarchaea archaeon]
MKWKSLLREDPTEWLLEKENPSIRYWTLRDICQKSESDPDVVQSKKEIMMSYPVTEILKNEDSQGFWVSVEDPYLPKYRATFHQLLILSELGASPCDQIKKAIEVVFSNYQYYSGHFKAKRIKTERGRKSDLVDGGCLTGNIVRALIHFGYLHDERTQKAIEFLVNTHDKGWFCRAYPIEREKFFPQNCYMGGVKPFTALSMIPESERTAEMRRIINEESEIYLENEIFMYLKNEKGKRKEKFGWKRFGFPLFYQSDALEVLDVLAGLGVRDDRMNRALDLVISKQDQKGRWKLENTFNGKMWVNIEEKGLPSKWITLKVVRVLKRVYGG